jgi:hypothetical protein
MDTRLIVAAVLLVGLLFGGDAGAQQAPAGKAAGARGHAPQDLILAVDVSLSMLMDWHEGKTRYDASDREGMRWDGIQFAVDVARPQDRIALVLYRAENTVLSKYLDPSGFVSLAKQYPEFGNRTGREVLTELIREIQKQEESWAKEIKKLQDGGRGFPEDRFNVLEFELLRNRPGGKIDLAHGTSSLLALRAITEQLLPQLRDDAQGRTFLFTDGKEQSPEKPKEPAREKEHAQLYGYMKELQRVKGADLDRLVDGWVKEFAEKKHPIYTFGLGLACDLDVLESIAHRSNPGDLAGRRAASYNPKTNAELLRQLQYVEWELREYWKLPLRVTRKSDLEVFYTPRVQVWHDLGVLMYRHQTAAGKQPVRALAPLAGDMRTLPQVGEKKLDWLKPLMSRSHWYYSLSPGAGGAQPPVEGDLRFAVEHRTPGAGAYQTHGVAAVRTRESLFEFTAPDAATAYTPRDAIPFEVVFRPYQVPGAGGKPDVPFQAEQFRIQVTLTPAPGASPNARALPPLDLVLLPPEPDSKDRALAARRFRLEYVFDSDPNSKGRAELVGPWFVDIVIQGLKGPLEGAERRLIRRRLDVKAYPGVNLAGKLELTNEPAGATAATVAVDLDMPTAGGKTPTQLDARIVRAPFFEDKEVAATGFKVTAALSGKTGTVRVELPAALWSALATQRYELGQLRVRTPWGKEADVELVVRKQPYRVTATPDAIRLDLSARGTAEVRKELRVVLDTQLETAEPVELSGAAEANTQPPVFEQVLDEAGKPVGKGKAQPAAFRVEGLGKAWQLRGQSPKGTVVPFAIAPAGAKLSPGMYRGKLYLVGRGLRPTPVTIDVTVNLAVVKLKGNKNPVDELYLFGLAGTTVKRTLTFDSALRYAVSRVEVAPDWKPLTPREPGTWDRLTLRPEVHQKGAEVTLHVSVPRSVHEGWYSSEVSFLVTPEAQGGQEAHKLQVSLPVYLQVSHVGVTFQSDGKAVKGPLRLPLPKAGADQSRVAAGLTLHTDAEKAAVRWDVERIKPGAGVGTALSPGDGRLAVLFKGRNILLQHGPSDPISRDGPVPVTVQVSRAGLAPGLYRSALRFHSYEDLPGEVGGKGPKGLTNDLEVEFLVPGRQVSAEVVPNGRPQLGKESALQVKVACYDCAPGSGELRTLDDALNALEPAVVIDGPPVKMERDPNLPGLSWHTYQVKVTPKHAGKNRYQIHWPGLSPQDLKPVEVSVDALGAIEVKHGILHANEETVIRATLDPRQAPASGPVVLHAVNELDADRQPIAIELYDDGLPEHGDDRAGDGVYSAKFRFPGLGKYTLSPPAGVSLEPVTVQVGFEFTCPNHAGVVEYGGGAVQEFFQIPKELTATRVIKLKNNLPATCRWRARVRYPVMLEDSWNIAKRDPDAIRTGGFDPKVHLDTRLIGDAGADGREAGWERSGVLRRDEEITLGIASALPAPAWDELDGGNVEAGAHPTFNRDNGMVLEMELEWVDEDGRVLERRRVTTAFTVATRSWILNPKPIAAALGVVGLVVFLWKGVPAIRRRWKRRQQGGEEQGGNGLLPASRGAENAAAKPGAARRFRTWLGGGRAAPTENGARAPGLTPSAAPEHGDNSVPGLLPPSSAGDDNDLLPPEMR